MTKVAFVVICGDSTGIKVTTQVKRYALNIMKGKISIKPQGLNSVAYLVFLSPEQTEESDVCPPFLLVSGGLLAFPAPCVRQINDYYNVYPAAFQMYQIK